MRTPLWRSVLIFGVCLVGLLLVIPNFVSQATLDRLPGFMPKNRIMLGLDLQGGSYLLLEVQTDAIVKERLDNLVNDIRGTLRAARVGYRGIGVQGNRVMFTLTDPTQKGLAQEKLNDVNPRLSTVGFGSGAVREFDADVDDTGHFVAAPSTRRP